MRFASFLIASLALAPVQAADLLDIYRKAHERDPVFAAARAQYRSEQERVPQARAGLLPFVELDADHNFNDFDTRLRGDTILRAGSRDFRTYGYTLSLTQPLYRKQNFVALEQAQIQLFAAEATLAAAGQNLILRVAQAYFDVLASQDTLEFIGAQKAAISEQLALAKRNFEVGTATIVDTHEAQARSDLVLAQEIAARNELENRQRALQQIIGEAAPALDPLAVEAAFARPQPDDMNAWVESATENNLQVEIQRAAAEVADKEIEISRAGHLPTLDAVAAYNEDHATGSATFGGGSDITSRVIGLQLNVPIYQGGFVTSRVRQTIALKDRTREELENARRDAAFATQQAFLSITNGIAQVDALKAARESNVLSLQSTQVGQEVGVRTSVDVLNAQQLLFATRRDLAQARYNTILNLLRLKQAAGSLDIADLAQVNDWLAGN